MRKSLKQQLNINSSASKTPLLPQHHIIDLELNQIDKSGFKQNTSSKSPEKLATIHQRTQETKEQDFPDKDNRNLLLRYSIFGCCVCFLIIGRYNVPENEPPCVVDHVLNLLGDVNSYILANPLLRDSLQVLCSLFMDIMFLATFIHWIYKGKSGRLIFVTGMFYLIRAAVQSIWYSPFPEGYWWNSPGIPSLVVPYGRGSDFFFSGHAGFTIICLNEWRKNENPVMVKFIMLGSLYTMFILIAFRIHYSIDVFTGVIVAHWCFMIVDQNKEKIDSIFIGAFGNVKGVFRYESKTMSGNELYGDQSSYVRDQEKELETLRISHKSNRNLK